MSDQPQRPTSNDDREAWSAYWTAQGMPWRTEQEIDAERQRYLAERRTVKPDIEKGIYPFRDEKGSIKLTRADAEWLLATHESGGMRGPVEWSDVKQREREGLDVRGADLRKANLRGMPLARARGSLTNDELPEGAANADDRALEWSTVCLERANLSGAHLERSHLREVHLEGADLRGACLDRASLYRARLGGANLSGASLAGTNMVRAKLDESTNLYGAALSSKLYGGAALRDIHWGGVDLTVVAWDSVLRLGDERVLKTRRATNDYQNIVRANRQVAVAVRSQGLNEHADRFAYRAQVIQRQAFLRRGMLLRYIGSFLLDLISGYGYKPLRSFLTYLLVIIGFAATYFVLGSANGQPFSWNETIVVSMTAFHGRGFFSSAFQAGDPQAAVAAVEAFIGLFIEITFIATFTQRFFAR